MKRKPFASYLETKRPSHQFHSTGAQSLPALSAFKIAITTARALNELHPKRLNLRGLLSRLLRRSNLTIMAAIAVATQAMKKRRSLTRSQRESPREEKLSLRGLR